MKTLQLLGLAIFTFFHLVSVLNAAISIGIGQTGPLTFNTPPTIATGWSTLSHGSSSTTSITTTNDMDTAMQNVAASNIANALGSTTTFPPAANGIARWNNNTPNGFFIQTRPAGNMMTLVLATLQNPSGETIRALTIEYDLGSLVTSDSTINESIFGYRAYYSFTGETSSWQVIPEFCTGTPGHLSATLNLNAWSSGSMLYIVWADDNGPSADLAPLKEGGYFIDNLAFTAIGIPGELTNLTTHLPADVAANEYAAVAFQLQVGGDAPHYQWFKNDVPIASGTSFQWSITSVTPQDSGLYFCVASNQYNTVTSRIATLLVNPDVIKPSVQSVQSGGNPSLLTVFYSEPVREDSATNLANYSLTSEQGTPLPIASAFMLSNTAARLILAEPRSSLVPYRLAISGIQDRALTPNTMLPKTELLPPLPIQIFGMNQVWRPGFGHSLEGGGLC